MTPVQLHTKALHTCMVRAGVPISTYQAARTWMNASAVNQLLVLAETFSLKGDPLPADLLDKAMIAAREQDELPAKILRKIEKRRQLEAGRKT